MDATNFPFKESGFAALAMVLLKILYDAVYVKIPKGLEAIREELTAQLERGNDRHNELMQKHVELQKAINKMRKSFSMMTPDQAVDYSPRRKRKTQTGPRGE